MNDITRLERLLALSRDMLDHAGDEDWGQVELLQTQRKALLESFVLTEIEASLKGRAIDILKAVLALDDRIIALGQAGKLQLQATLTQMNVAKKAVKAYNA
jgi:hypothetical protein